MWIYIYEIVCCEIVMVRGKEAGNRWTDRQAGGQIDRQVDRQTGRWTDRQAGGQINRQVDRSTGRWTEGWKNRVKSKWMD